MKRIDFTRDSKNEVSTEVSHWEQERAPRLSGLPRLTLLAFFLLLIGFSLPARPQSDQARFEIATVKPAAPNADASTGSWSPPGRAQFTATNVSLATLIQLAYDVTGDQVLNKPAWLDQRLYDVSAKPEGGVKLTREELRPRLQKLLQERFGLRVHNQTLDVRGYALVVSKKGQHLTPPDVKYYRGFRTNVSLGEMHGHNWDMPTLAKYLSLTLQYPVIDETGIRESFDVDFSYSTEDQKNPDQPALVAALKDSTGLDLRTKKVPVQAIVIDSLDQIPTPN